MLVAIFLVFYALGWRFDWRQFAFKRTGSVYVSVESPYQTVVKVSDQIKSAGIISGFFGGGVLFESLPEKNYSLEISKDGYQTWRKNINVVSNSVTRVSGIILAKKAYNARELILSLHGIKSIDGFILGSEEKALIWQANPFRVFSVNLDLASGQEIFAIQSSYFPQEYSLSYDGKKVLMLIGSRWYIFDLNQLTVVRIDRDFKNALNQNNVTSLESVKWLNGASVLIEDKKTLRSLDLTNGSIELFAPLVNYANYWFAFSKGGELIFTDKEQNLYLMESSGDVQLIANNTKRAGFFEQGERKIFALENATGALNLKTIFLESGLDPKFHQKGEAIYSSFNDAEINDIMPIGSLNILIIKNHSLYLRYINDEGGIIEIELIDFKITPKFYGWNNSTKNFYWLEDGKLKYIVIE